MTKSFTRSLLAAIVLSLGCASVNAQFVTILDDFSGASSFTQTVILDTANPAVNSNTVLQSVGDAGNFNTTMVDAIEQSAWIFPGQSLAIGDTLALDVSIVGNQDVGIYVGDTAPTAATAAVNDARADFVIAFARTATQAANAVFDDTFPGGNTGNLGGVNTFDGVFITHTAQDSFDLGFINGGVFTTERSFTADGGNSASVIGLYTDIRGNGDLGTFDNFRIISPVPEPMSAALAGLGLIFVSVFRRRRVR